MDSYVFSFSSFLAMVLPLVLLPTLLGAGIIWIITRTGKKSALIRELSVTEGQRRRAGWTSGGRLGLWSTGVAGAVLGLIACVGWLSWSASDKGGGFTSPGFPPPDTFPTWQLIACGLTTVGAALIMSLCSRSLVPGACAAALGTTAGFSTGIALGVATEVTSQEGIGVALSMIGLTYGLGLITLSTALLRAWYIHRTSLSAATTKR